MRFTLTIDSDNAAVTDDNARDELARLLETAAGKVRDGYHHSDLRDYNGNNVGSWSLEEDQ